MTVPYAEVIGDPIAQSKSPAIHGFWLKKLGIEADYRATCVNAAGLEAYLAERRADPDWRGCNVTMPHKQAVQPYLDTVVEPAAAIGAVNTIHSTETKFTGHNTDAGGFLEPLRPMLNRQHYFRMARILGTGPTRRALCWTSWPPKANTTPSTSLTSRKLLLLPSTIARAASI